MRQKIFDGYHIYEIKERSKIMKRIFNVLLVICLLTLSLPLKTSASDTSYSWYCKRVNGNAQPPLPTEFSFIEKYPCIWLDKSGSKKVY